jgi:hypothetical protein
MNGAPATAQYTISLVGNTSTRDAFGAVREMDSRNDEKMGKPGKALKIIEIEFLRNLK